MTELSQALSAALLHFIWQGTAVAFLLWVALFVLRRRTPNARYIASCIALTLMAALPLATAWIVYRQPSALSPSVAMGAAIPAAMKSIGVQPRAWMEMARQWALPVWAAGVLLFALRLAMGYRHLRVLRRAGEAVEAGAAEVVAVLARRMNIARPVRVLVSKLADSPCVIGWLRPAILMPAAALAGLDAGQLEAILAHEMAHIRRHDFVVNVLQTVVETMLFYHPATWWASSRIRQEREYCCDDLAVRHCGDAAGYARALTKLERARVLPEPAVAANGGALLDRIQRLTGAVRECAPSRLPVILAVLAAAVCAPLTIHRAHAEQQIVHAELEAQTSSKAAVRDRLAVAARNGMTGTVLLEATLDEKGQAVDTHVITGPLELRKASLRAVLEARFANATKGEARQVSVDFAPEPLISKRTHIDADVPPVSLYFTAPPPTPNAGEVTASQENTDLQIALEEIQRKLARVKLPEDELQRQQYMQIVESSGERQLRTLEQQLAELSETLSPENVKVRRLNGLIETVRRQMTRELAGRKLVRIEGETLPLKFQLAVQVGDVLTAEAMQKVVAAMKEADLGLDARFVVTSEGGIVIRIERPQPH